VQAVSAHADSLGEYELRRDEAARKLWRNIYAGLSDGKPGLFGAVTSRAEAQVMRLACLYALLGKAKEIRVEHLRAALALWHYCEASARFVFGDALGDPLAVLTLLRRAQHGLTRTELNNSLGRNRAAADIDRALVLLAEYGLARFEKEETAGRTAERWLALRLEDSEADADAPRGEILNATIPK
jgi:hypothetical protein